MTISRQIQATKEAESQNPGLKPTEQALALQDAIDADKDVTAKTSLAAESECLIRSINHAINHNLESLKGNPTPTTVPSVTAPPSCTPIPPKMGGSTQTSCGQEAWVGRKPLGNWSGLEVKPDPDKEDPLPAQMHSKSAKAATAQLKRAEGIHLSGKKKFTEKGGDACDFMS